MYLKRITLHGFKSFADRTEFDFARGRTSIVGPNGCGKSNVLDAIRWVLGEQSAKTMRGSKMLDVVFAGSRARKAANFAEVQLAFDNSTRFLNADGDEVSVGRVLYRSGESEYQINGKTCRLKDIRDLFLDTGVGVDAYSVIEQGRVDALLKANPTERREIFEEAAGVSRYKARRLEAQRKLERTQNNLLRLNDVADELEKRLRSVKLAAGKARNFIEYDERLRELRSSFSLAEYHELELTRRALARRIEAFSDIVRAKRVALARRDADLLELQNRLQALDESIHAAEVELRGAQSEVAALEERIAQGARRIAELGENRARRAVQAEEAAASAAGMRERLAAESESFRSLVDEERRTQEAVAQAEGRRTEADQRRRETRVALDQEKSAAFEGARKLTVLSNERRHVEAETARLEAQSQRLRQRKEIIESQSRDLVQRRDEARAGAEAFDQQATELGGAARSVEARIAELEAQAREHDARLASEREARSGVLSRLKLLEEMEHKLEGVDQGARWVLNWEPDARAAAGVLGLVADVLQIDDPRVGALQSLLSQFENHLVVRDRAAFLQALDDRGDPPGLIHAFALDALRSRPRLNPPGPETPGVLAPVLDWARCQREFEPLAHALLGRVYLASDSGAAMALAGAAEDSYVFVTPDGRMIESDGRITIGGGKGEHGLISRKAEIRQLGLELDELETRIERAARERSATDQTLSDERVRREALLQELAGVQRSHAEARMALARVSDEAARVEREASAIEMELGQAQRAETQLQQRIRELAAEEAQAQASLTEHERRVEELQGRWNETEQEVAALASELAAAQVEAGRAAERRRAGEAALRDLRSRLESLEREQSQALAEVEQAARQIEAAQAELALSEQRREELAQRVERISAAAMKQRDARQTLRRRVESSGLASRLIQAEVDEVDAALREHEMAAREAQIRTENLVTRAREELSVDLAEVYVRYRHAERDWDEVQREIDELRGKIARLGNVNLDSISELDELTPRYERLAAQREDLMQSVGQLESLITELDVASRERFLAVFEQAREYFIELFRKLFGGGKADIILMDPANPLECGIEILARPPGKEPTTISLLSGGERTMAAVALLFAVFKCKPSPFTILDEVDAALDEANVDRFNNMVSEFQNQSQFILITHNKRTMQCADTLYGITMEEPGVSKRVSVRFDDRVETPLGA